MTIFRTLGAATACVAALGVGGAAMAASNSGEEGSEATLATSAPHSLLDAVKTAESAASGRAFEASIEGDKGQTLYLVSTLASGNVMNVAVDPQTGKVTAKEQPGLLSRLMDDAEEGIDQAKIAMPDAIATAENAAGGKAMEAGLEGDDDEGAQAATGLFWSVLVAGQGDGARTMVAVDAQSGDVLASGPATHDDDDE